MNRSAWPAILLMILGGGFLIVRATTQEMGKQYVKETPVTAREKATGEVVRTWVEHENVAPNEDIEAAEPADDAPVEDAAEPEDPDAELKVQQAAPARFEIERGEPVKVLSVWRTLGIWLAGFLTLAVLSFLYGDNPFYKLAEAIFVGVSAAYLMVVGFWTTLVEKLFVGLFPQFMRANFLPGVDADQSFDAIYLVPLALGILMLMRLSPKGAWLSRWPLAFFIGATAGFRLLGFFEADFVAQLRSTILPLLAMKDGGYDFWASVRNITITVGVLTTLFYFFFSVEHTGVAGGVARIGVFFLMITFGANFAYTVMGRIALLAQRLEFLFDDWLWLIDPLNRR